MSRERLPITTMEGLLRALSREWGDRKTSARVEHYHADELRVIENFDDSKGPSNAFTSEISLLSKEVFDEALRLGYITGLVKPGYISQNEFKLSGLGQEEYQRIKREIAEHVPELNND